MADLTATVSEALHDASTDPDNSMTPKDATAITPEVAKEVNKEVNKIVTNITNQEPWYQSRVLVGAFVAVVAQGLKALGVADVSPTDQVELVNLGLQLATFAGLAFTIYGRVVAQKPLGT